MPILPIAVYLTVGIDIRYGGTLGGYDAAATGPTDNGNGFVIWLTVIWTIAPLLIYLAGRYAFYRSA